MGSGDFANMFGTALPLGFLLNIAPGRRRRGRTVANRNDGAARKDRRRRKAKNKMARKSRRINGARSK